MAVHEIDLSWRIWTRWNTLEFCFSLVDRFCFLTSNLTLFLCQPLKYPMEYYIYTWVHVYYSVFSTRTFPFQATDLDCCDLDRFRDIIQKPVSLHWKMTTIGISTFMNEGFISRIIIESQSSIDSRLTVWRLMKIIIIRSSTSSRREREASWYDSICLRLSLRIEWSECVYRSLMAFVLDISMNGQQNHNGQFLPFKYILLGNYITEESLDITNRVKGRWEIRIRCCRRILRNLTNIGE